MVHDVTSKRSARELNDADITRSWGPRPLIVLSGDLDIATRDRLCAALAGAHRAKLERLTVDTTAVSFLDCSCVGVIVSARNAVVESGGEFKLLVGAGGIVPRVLRLLRLYGALSCEVASGYYADATPPFDVDLTASPVRSVPV